MSKVAGEMWDRFIARAYWLTWADTRKARLWCVLEAEAQKSVAKLTASRIAQLRALGSELGFDPASRARLDVPAGAGGKGGEDPIDKYLA